MNRVFFMGMLFAGLGLTAFADTFVFGVDSLPNHNYGSGSNTFTFGTSTFTTQEFNDTALYSKSGGGDENGLGVTGDPDHDNESLCKEPRYTGFHPAQRGEPAYRRLHQFQLLHGFVDRR